MFHNERIGRSPEGVETEMSETGPDAVSWASRWLLRLRYVTESTSATVSQDRTSLSLMDDSQRT